ncbi:MAG: hypothetical protein LBD75_03930 [Candidatus Peribacteria bacterium]|jgi:hypothetical protein|nr:hypothetical protein [Candidatus Peribacteria bacterium]
MADNSLQSLEELTSTPADTSSTTTLAGSTPENESLQDTLSPTPSLGEEKEKASVSPNIFLDTTTVESKEESDKDEKNKFVSRYIRRFIVASFITVINIILIGLIFVYDTYITQTSKLKVEKYDTLVSSTKEYLQLITSYLGNNYESKYVSLPLLIPDHERNLTNIITTSELSYTEKKDILKGKVSGLISTVTSQVAEIEEIKKNIAKF